MSSGSDNPTDESMRNLLSHVSDEEAAEVVAEAAPDMTEAERRELLKRVGKGKRS